MKFRLLYFLFINLFIQVGCIHFKLGESEPQKSLNISFKEPLSPFVISKNTDADQAWESNKTGNIIAITSNCSKNSDKSLNFAFQEIAKGFDRVDSSNQTSLFFNGREALRGSVSGTIDGISVSMETLQFNKNQCFYQLTYSGVSKNFESEQHYFEQFLKDFKAP